MATAETALALVDEQFNARQLDIITNQIAKGASEEELAYFLEVCRATGLNPLHRQIYAIMRSVKEGDKWVKHMTIQTGIDGYRLIAARTGQLAGIDDPVYDTEDAEQPKRASVTVWRFVGGHRVPFTATARWTEYAALDKDGKPQSMWKKMPYLMLGKCAEALALRKAFPAELSGVYTGEEMAQADNDGPQGYVEAAPTMFQEAPATLGMTPEQKRAWADERMNASADRETARQQALREPEPIRTATAAARSSRWTGEQKRALMVRWLELQPDEPGMRTAKRFTAAMEQFLGTKAPFDDAQLDRIGAHVTILEERRTAAAATVTEETPAAEAEPIPFDLRTAPIKDMGA